MQYTVEFRNKDEALALAERIRTEVDSSRQYRYMEFCGGHTHVLARWGLTDLLPSNIRMIHGPGCPVCVLPIGRVDMALDLALNKNVTLCTYADMMRVPGSGGQTLFKAKAQGADVRMVYSPTDALKLARDNPDRQVVFFAIGFETTTPPTALVLKSAKNQNVENFSVVCSHVITPAAMRHIMLSHGKDAKPFIDGIVGIIGPNGAGKTTLFRLIMGLEKADKGEFEVGETVKVAYVDQQHKDIDPNKSVYQVISGGNDLIRMGGRDINARAYLSRFNFSGADQEKLCGVLSGGERNRLHLALCLKEEGNVLLLDEPTNDIDVNTLRALEEGLEDFAGCAVVISHDRWFLDRICTHILAFEGDSNVFFFEGSYSEYEENKQKRLGKEEPTRVRYRKLMND